MDILKIVFVSFIMGKYEISTVYIKEKEVIVETQHIGFNYSQSEYYDFNANIIRLIDDENKVNIKSIDEVMKDTGGWESFPPISFNSTEKIIQKELREEKLYIKTKTEVSIHEYELLAIPVKIYLKDSRFFNFLFDKNFQLVSYRRDFNHNNRETGFQKIESIEKISETEFEEVIKRFK